MPKTLLYPVFWSRFCAVLVVLLGCMPESLACAAAPRPGKRAQVAVENAVIVWDAMNKTEHFIRSAVFDTDSPDLGFLVPTPGLPTLAEANVDIFLKLKGYTEPEHVTKYRNNVQFYSWLKQQLQPHEEPIGESVTKSTMATGAAPVRVVSEQTVAGYDAVVLKAEDAAALDEWLKTHGYAASPELMEWLRPYVANHWYVTAFKVAARGEGSARVGTALVRMSFQTETPLFPYREPERTAQQMPIGERLLRIYFLTEQRVAGIRGTQPMSAPSTNASWDAPVTWTDVLPEKERAGIAHQLGIGTDHLPKTLRMTVFEDKSSVRQGGDDVFFPTASVQDIIHAEPIVSLEEARYHVPLEPPTLVLLGGLWGLRRVRRRRRD